MYNVRLINKHNERKRTKIILDEMNKVYLLCPTGDHPNPGHLQTRENDITPGVDNHCMLHPSPGHLQTRENDITPGVDNHCMLHPSPGHLQTRENDITPGVDNHCMIHCNVKMNGCRENLTITLKLNFRKYPAIHTNYITLQSTTL